MLRCVLLVAAIAGKIGNMRFHGGIQFARVIPYIL